MTGWLAKYRALAVGVVGPLPSLDDLDVDSAAIASAPLTFAPGYASALRDVLEDYGYAARLSPDDEPRSAGELNRLIESTVDAPGFAVVHLLTHGTRGKGTGALYVMGPDGKRLSTSVEEWLNRVENNEDDDPPLVLFILDVCYAGGPVVLSWQQFLRSDRRQAWIIGASGADDPAYDGRLTRAVTEVLRRFKAGDLRVDPIRSHIPLRRICREVARLVEQYADEGPEQRIETTRVSLDADTDRLRFFSNPYHSHGWTIRDHVDPALAALLDEAVDYRHFTGRASGAEAMFQSTDIGFFHGRAEELRILSAWAMGEGPPFRIVTGKPGVGKSALLGVMVCAAHPALRKRTRPLWQKLDDVPPLLPNLAVVHARRRSLDVIAAAIARQWNLGSPPIGTGWNADSIATAIQRRDQPPIVILDALDEAERPEDVVAALIVPLAAVIRSDGSAVCRMLVGTRPETRFQDLFDRARNGGLMDLGVVSRSRLRVDLGLYIHDLLRNTSGYGALKAAPAAKVLAEAIARALTTGDGGEHDPAPLAWGEYLVAGLYVHYLFDRVVEDVDAAARLGEAVPRDLLRVLELDLGRRGDRGWLRPVAAALAFAEGAGMPEGLVARAAGAFNPFGGADGPDLADVRDALEALRFYLRRDVDTDGSTLYRLFHQGLADQLRDDPLGPRPDTSETRVVA